MRAVVQRVRNASVTVAMELVSSIDRGLLVYLGVGREDGEKETAYLADKIANLRIFEDSGGKMNLSLLDVDQDIIVVSQFTLYADARKGRRPSYNRAEEPDRANTLYELFMEKLRILGCRVQGGRFQAMMDITYTNTGPVTILLDSDKEF